MRKIKTIGILITVLSVFFIGLMSNNITFPDKDPETLIESLSGNDSEITDIPEEMHSDPMIPETSLQNDLTQNEWIQGETVSVSYTFANHYLEVDTQEAFLQDLGDDFLNPGIYAYHESYSNDGVAYGAGGGKNLDSDNTNSFRYEVQLLGRTSGTLYIDGWWTCTGASVGGSHSFTNQEYSVTSDNLDANGYITVHFESVWDVGGNEYDNAIAIYNFTKGDVDTIWSQSYDTPDGPPDRTELRLDELRFQQDPILSYIRSEYQYSISGALQHKLTIENFEYRTTITAYIPEHWVYSLINPTAQVTLSGNDIIVTNTIPTIYLILFSSFSSQFLAISDVSGNYLYDNGFEGSWQYDLTEDPTNPFDSIDLNSTIVYEGTSSLRLQDTNSYGVMPINFFHSKAGNYYLKISHYTENYPDNHYALVYKDSSGNYVYLYLTQGNNRWHSDFFFLHHVDLSYGLKFYFQDSDETYIVFIDGLEIWEVNHQHETIAYSQLFTGQMIKWNGYSNKPVPFHTVQLDLRDWTSDTSLISYETVTDSEGYFSLLFEGTLEQKNYEFRSWSWNSWFGLYSYEKWTALSDYAYSDSRSLDTINYMVGDSSVKFEDSSGTLYPWLESIDEDITNMDYLTFWAATNYSETLDKIQVRDDAITFTTKIDIDESIGTTWTRYFCDLNNFEDVTGVYDPTAIEDMFCTVTSPASPISFWWDGINFIQAQKSYFTPLPVSHSDYAITAQENNPYDYVNYWGVDGWDFQEGTLDGMSITGAGSLSSEKGTLLWEADTSTWYCKIGMTLGGSIDSSYYNILEFRVKTNETWNDDIDQGVQVWRLYDGDGNALTNILGIYGGSASDCPYELTTDFTQFQFEISDSDWNGMEDGIVITFAGSEGNGKNFDGNETITMDYLRLSHVNSGLKQGHSWEFEEETYNDGWEVWSGSSISTANGEITVSAPTQFDGMRINLETEYLAGDWDYCSFEIRAEGITTDLKLVLNIDGDSQITLAVPAISSTYQVIRIAVDSWGFDNIHLKVHQTQTGTFWVKWIHLEKDSPPNLYYTDTDLLLDNEGLLGYKTVTDGFSSPEFFSNKFIPKNLTVGSHSFEYSAFQDYFRWGVFLPSAFYQYEYSIAESDIMKIIIHDQSGNILNFDSFKTFIDGTRLYDNYIYSSDTSQTFNLTIADLFDNLLYQDTTEAFEQFKEIQLTLYSVKTQNLQENPIWFQITRDTKTYSEWIYPYEIVDYRLEAATYDFTVYYCDSISGDIGAVTTNGTYVNFNYAVSADSAIIVTGETIRDVFDNTISLIDDVDLVNSSIHLAMENQTENLTIQFTATNQNITFVLGNSSVMIDTLNSNFTAVLGDLILLDSNINGNFTTTFLAIAGNTTLLVNQLNSNFTELQGLIISNNTVLYTQLVHTLADLAELKGLFTVHFDFVDGIGIGLSWETFKLYLNDSRQYGQEYYTPNQTQIRLKTLDYFNVSLDTANYTINNSCDISIIVDVYEIIFRNNNTQFKSIVEITRGGQNLVLSIEPEGTISHRFTEGKYTLNVSYIVEQEITYDIKNPENYTVGIHNLFKSSFSIGSQLKLMDKTLDSKIVDIGAPDPKATLRGMLELQLVSAFVFGVLIATFLTALFSYFWRTRVIEPIDEQIDFSSMRKKVQKPVIETSSDVLGALPLTERKHAKASKKKDNRRR